MKMRVGEGGGCEGVEMDAQANSGRQVEAFHLSQPSG